MKQLFEAISTDLPKDINEIRLVMGKPVSYKIGNKVFRTKDSVTQKIFSDVLKIVTFDSVYAVGECVSRGYISYKDGIRVGLAGEYAVENGKPKSIRNVNGLVVRFPKEIRDCSRCVTAKNFDKNILVVSPPYAGKTTFLRDLARRISDYRQVVVIDERKELSGDGVLDVGESMILSGISKCEVYEGVIRSLSPETVVTDELFGASDYATVEDLISKGIGVVASVHGKNLESIPEPLKKFDVKVLLSCYPETGSVAEVRYD